ncbi:hypothetical protein [Seonamhaeicola marinus]|uniref:Uncharacterized protein n=1 Tax=Seonamhaeicola marinus TaxID=1912246 RepID=A0A5D0HV96_9FLAO|nr:hypothetical protein [Seonamhaeicola marinus]TYA74841.1 hypothetical protein FUA24_16175 [Seonamhaeicola marinus]
MTNLNKLYALYDISRSSAQEALKDLLINHLPKEYTNKVIKKLEQEGVIVDSQTIRNTKAGLIKNILIFNSIIEIAKEHKTLSNRLKKNLLKTKNETEK